MTAEPLHLPTLIIAAAMGIAFAGVMLLLARWRDRQANALGLWGCALLVSASGLLVIAAAPLPRPWPVIVGDAVLVLGAGLSWAGARVFRGQRVLLGALAAGPVGLVGFAALAGAAFYHVELTLTLVGGYSVAAAVELGRTRREKLPSTVTAIALAGIHAALQFARAAVMLFAARWFSAHAHAVYTAVFLEALLYAIGMSSALMSMMKEKAEAQSTWRLRRMTMVDELTGLGNRRQFDEALVRHVTRASLTKRPLALLMVDVDYFKMYNDTYGHIPGDDCLRAIASAIGPVVRRKDAIATRYGGEEFAILLGGTDEFVAMQVAARVHAGVAALAIKHAMSPYGVLTVSIGVAAVMPGDPADALVRQADWALYVAKAEGRNGTRAASETRHSGVLRPTA